MRFQLATCVKLKMNVLAEIISIKTRKLVNPNRPKNKFLKPFQTARPFQTEKIYQVARTKISKNLSKRETLKNQPELSKLKNCQYLKMFQVATNIGHNVGSYTQGRIAGDFLSSREVA
jgi:hypothetical protein